MPEPESIKIWDFEVLESGLINKENSKELSSLRTVWNNFSPEGLAISADNKLVAISCHKKQICLWDMQTKRLRRKFYYFIDTGSLAHLAFSPDSKTLTGSSSLGKVVLWRMPTKLSLFKR